MCFSVELGGCNTGMVLEMALVCGHAMGGLVKVT
jgi:hypothetical protein